MKKYILFAWLCVTAVVSNGQTGIITTIAGTGIAGFGGDYSPASVAQFNIPFGLAVDGLGNIYIADRFNYRIRKIDPAGTITTFAGTGVLGYLGDGGPATAARLQAPSTIIINGPGNIIFSDGGYIRMINSAGIISTVGGTGGAGYNGDGHHATATNLGTTLALTIGSGGTIYISSESEHRILKFDPSAGSTVTTIGGTGISGFSGDGLAATNAQISYPWGIAVDGFDNIFFCDNGNNRVRKISSSGIISTVMGNGTMGHTGDGGPATAALTGPGDRQIAFDAAGNLFIPDVNCGCIHRIDPSGIVTNYAGNDTAGYSGDGGAATNAKLDLTHGIASYNNKVYISMSADHVIRQIKGLDLYAPSFTSGAFTTASVCLGDGPLDVSHLLAINDADTGETQTWSIASPASHGTAAASCSVVSTGATLTPTGITYTPTSGYTGNDTFKVSISDELRTDTITIYVTVHPHAFCHVEASKIRAEELKVFPNPSGDELYITGLQWATTYKLYNFTGICAQQGSLQQGSNAVSLQGIPVGIYTLELTGEDGERKMVRVMKE